MDWPAARSWRSSGHSAKANQKNITTFTSGTSISRQSAEENPALEKILDQPTSEVTRGIITTVTISNSGMPIFTPNMLCTLHTEGNAADSSTPQRPVQRTSPAIYHAVQALPC